MVSKITRHYIDESGFDSKLEIPDFIADEFFRIFVKPNITAEDIVNMDGVLELIWKAERKVYNVMYLNGICANISNDVTVEESLDGDEFGLFVFELLKVFIANDFFEAEFPLFLHNTLMDYGINLYTFSD